MVAETASRAASYGLAMTGVGYAELADHIGISGGERSVSLNPNDVGRTLRCGECNHQFVITPNTKIIKTLKDRNGKVIGFTTPCDTCGESVFIGASPDRRR
jgi:DNA-directed RNA polymerase subunit RPC12/RpoP